MSNVSSFWMLASFATAHHLINSTSAARNQWFLWAYIGVPTFTDKMTASGIQNQAADEGIEKKSQGRKHLVSVDDSTTDQWVIYIVVHRPLLAAARGVWRDFTDHCFMSSPLYLRDFPDEGTIVAGGLEHLYYERHLPCSCRWRYHCNYNCNGTFIWKIPDHHPYRAADTSYNHSWWAE